MTKMQCSDWSAASRDMFCSSTHQRKCYQVGTLFPLFIFSRHESRENDRNQNEKIRSSVTVRDFQIRYFKSVQNFPYLDVDILSRCDIERRLIQKG